jgi:hypothetical protein
MQASGHQIQCLCASCLAALWEGGRKTRQKCGNQASQTAAEAKCSAPRNIHWSGQFPLPRLAGLLVRSPYGRFFMSLINILIPLVVVGVILWLINNYLPMDGKIKNILNIVVVIAVILWLLRAFGVLGSLGGI